MNKKTYTHFRFEERAILSLGLAQGQALHQLAIVLGRSPSTLSRERRRNAPKKAGYHACPAQHRATTRRRRARRPRKLLDPWLWRYVRTHVLQGHSPEQIAGRLRHEYPHEMQKHLSAETIYVGLSVFPRGSLRSKRLTALRQARKARRPRARGHDRRGHLSHMTLITERPAEVETRTVPGHWEGDHIKGARNGSAVGTLVERTSRLVLLARLEGADAQRACDGFTKKLRHIPAPLRKTLTYDRGKEMAEHEQLPQRLTIRVFFADPHSPWQLGTNENTNGLRRQYLPKGTDLSSDTQGAFNAIAQKLNTRPRKCLNWATPLEAFTQLCHQSSVALGT